MYNLSTKPTNKATNKANETKRFKAINKKNQPLVNKAVRLLIQYNELNDKRDVIENNEGDDTTTFRRIDRKCELVFDKYQDACLDLPIRETKAIEKSNLY